MRDKISDKIVQKIKKLMALGLGDPDSPEAKSALDKATMLMQKYSLAEIDLDKDGHVKADSLTETMVEVYSKLTDFWERGLGTSIAKAFDCRMITIVTGRGLPTRTFLGTKSDVELSIYFYKFIRMQIMRGAETKFHLVRDQKTYGMGCTIKVIDRLDDMYTKREEVMTSDSRSLIVVKKDDVFKFVQQRHPNIKKGKQSRITGSNDAYNQGLSDGSKIQMSRQVGNKSATGAIMIGS